MNNDQTVIESVTYFRSDLELMTREQLRAIARKAHSERNSSVSRTWLGSAAPQTNKMRSTKTTISISRKLLSDLLDVAINYEEAIDTECHNNAALLESEISDLRKQQNEVSRIIKRTNNAYIRSGGL